MLTQLIFLLIHGAQPAIGRSIGRGGTKNHVSRKRRERILLIVDEVQTALARCGAMWCSDLYDLKPDLVLNQDLFHVDSRLMRRIKGIGSPILSPLTSPVSWDI